MTIPGPYHEQNGRITEKGPSRSLYDRQDVLTRVAENPHTKQRGIIGIRPK